jgi:O-antigen/teichoic acid export membrane protein
MLSTSKTLSSEQIAREPGTAAMAPVPASLVQRLWGLALAQERNLRSLVVLVFINFFIAGVGFVTQVKIANTLGRGDFGLFAYGLAIAAYGGVFIRFGLDRTLVRDLIHYPERVGELVTASLLLRWMLFAVVAFVLVVWKLAAGAGSDVSWGLLLVILANSMMSMDLQPVYDSWKEMSRHAVYNLIQRCVYFAAIWTMVVVAPAMVGLLSIGVITLGSVVLYLMLQHGWAMSRMELPAGGRRVFAAAVTMAKGNLIIWLASVGTLSFGSLNQIVLKHYRGAGELGGYAAAWQMVSLATMLLYQVARIGNPIAAEVTRGGIPWKDRNRFLARYALVMVLTVSPLALAAVCFPTTIMRVVFRPEFVSAANTLRILGVYMVMFSVGLVASQFLVSLRQEKAYFISVWVGGVLSVAMCIWLIPAAGANGAALALTCSSSAAIGFCWYAIFRYKSATPSPSDEDIALGRAEA